MQQNTASHNKKMPAQQGKALQFASATKRSFGLSGYWPAAALARISSSALHDGAQTAWDLPSTFFVPIKERARCLPHKKQDIVAAPNEVVAANGEPDTLDL